MPLTNPLTYFFANGRADGRLADRERLGGKGAHLADLTLAGLPVPPGFTIAADAGAAVRSQGNLPEALRDEVLASVMKIEEAAGKRFGDPARPLLVAVRSGAAVSMPGMMETVLNVGLNDVVAATWAEDGDARFVYDSYRRLIAMYARTIDGVQTPAFEDALHAARRAAGLDDVRYLDADAMRSVAQTSLDLYRQHVARSFPQDVREQLFGAIAAVFKSWDGQRAVAYRQRHGISGVGTACTVQAMVFGNAGEDSCAGVAFTRDLSTGRNVFSGEFIVGAQGEDIVAGTHTPLNCKKWFPKWNAELWQQLLDVAAKLEARYRDVQDFEFTVEHGRLFLLQTRTAKRTIAAAVRIAVDLEKQGLIDRATALSRVDLAAARALIEHAPPVFDKKRLPAPIAVGLAASPGPAVGKPAFTADEAVRRSVAGETIILVRPETQADDVYAFATVAGILTSTGGLTSHAALEARPAGKPCVVGAGAIRIDPPAGRLSIGTGPTAPSFGRGDLLSIDGSTGRVYAGAMPTVTPKPSGALRTFLKWADEAVRA